MDGGDKVALMVGIMSFMGAGFQSVLVFVLALLNRKRDARIEVLEKDKKDKHECDNCGDDKPKFKL